MHMTQNYKAHDETGHYEHNQKKLKKTVLDIPQGLQILALPD